MLNGHMEPLAKHTTALYRAASLDLEIYQCEVDDISSKFGDLLWNEHVFGPSYMFDLIQH